MHVDGSKIVFRFARGSWYSVPEADALGVDETSVR